MAMNSSEQYAILNSDNFLQILNEDVPEGLKLFMSEMVKAPEMMNSNDEQSKDNKEEINAEEDDEDFVIENTQINEEIKNNDTEKDKKSEDNGENKNIIKEDKKKYNTPNLFKEVCKLLNLSEEEFEAKIGDFFTALSTDKRFIFIDSVNWDLKENHVVKVVVDEGEEDITDDISEEDEEEIDDDEDNDIEEDLEDDYSDDDIDTTEDDLKDLTVLDEDELEE